jgi:hypothetical protein
VLLLGSFLFDAITLSPRCVQELVLEFERDGLFEVVPIREVARLAWLLLHYVVGAVLVCKVIEFSG